MMPALIYLLALLFAQVQSQAQARSAPPAPPAYRISGIVVDAVTGAVVPRAELSIILEAAETKTRAGDNGSFSFEGLQPGKYQLYAFAQGYVREGFDQHGPFFTGIVVGNGQDSEHLVFRLHPQAVITGRVTDERGEPVRHADVTLFRAGVNDRRIGGQFGPKPTNDLGEYRFARLLPGKYYLAVSARPWYAQTGLNYFDQPEPNQEGISFSRTTWKPDPALDVVYPITFYPGVTDEHAAVELNLAAGGREEANIQLRAVPALHVRLTNLHADEKNPVGIGAFRRVFRSYSAPQNVESRQISPGEYEVAGLPPGDVTLLIVPNSGQSGPSPRTSIRMNLSGDETLDAAGTVVTSNVSGRVIWPSGSIPEHVQVNFIDAESRNVSTAVLKDGAFSFPALQAGTYRVFVQPRPGGEYVQSISASGAKASGTRVTIEGAGDVHLDINMGQGFGQVTGVAQLDGKPVAGVMVLLVPASGEDLEVNSRRDQSDSDGSFKLPNILPGKYVLMAIQDGWDLDWMNWQALKPYREKGRALQIAPKETKNLTVDAQHAIKKNPD